MESIPIKELLIDNNKDPYEKSKDLVQCIDKKVNELRFKKFINIISNKINVPKEVISFEIKQYLVRNHDFEISKFKKVFNLNSIFYTSIIFCLSLLYIFFNSRKKNQKELCEIIFDEIESKDELLRIQEIKKNFSSYKIITKEKKFDDEKNFFYFNYKNCDKDYLVSNFSYYGLGYLFEALKFSIAEKTNYIPLVTQLIRKAIKYQTIFGQIQSKYFYQEKHYTTSAIKNYLFKKNGGQVTSCGQKNIIHLHDTGFYISTDIFFSLGKKTFLTLKFCGAQVKKIIPVGSVYIEMKWLKSSKERVPEYDIINFGGNNIDKFSTNKDFFKNYYETFKWMVKISKKFPNLKIAIKHHFNLKQHDPIEAKILKNSNIKTIIAAGLPDKNYSYGYGFKTKFACTFASTLGYELIGHNKPCFFLDPKGKNIEFLNNENYNDSWKIKSYEDFEQKVKNIFYKTKNNNVSEKIINNEDFCLKSDNTSRDISLNLKKYKK